MVHVIYNLRIINDVEFDDLSSLGPAGIPQFLTSVSNNHRTVLWVELALPIHGPPLKHIL